MTENQNKQLKGNKIAFNADIKNFKADGSNVSITLTADAKKMNLNILNEISQNQVTVDLMSVQTEIIPENTEEAE